MTRLQKLLAAIPAPMDALLITNNKNQKYLTIHRFPLPATRQALCS